MPQIIVMADRSADRGEGMVMLRERVNLSDLESAHFARQLLERLGWAIGDAHEAEEEPSPELDCVPTHAGMAERSAPRRIDEEPARAEVEQYLSELSGLQPAQQLEGAAF
jgi:hypothetical protein